MVVKCYVENINEDPRPRQCPVPRSGFDVHEIRRQEGVFGNESQHVLVGGGGVRWGIT